MSPSRATIQAFTITFHLLIELADLLLDALQVRKCHFHQPPVDQVEFGAGNLIWASSSSASS
jgi:hypothetical protein